MGLEPILLLRTRILSPVRLPIPPRPPASPRVYQSGLRIYGGTAGVFGVGFLEALEGPFGHPVGDGAGEVESGESVEALHVASRPAHAGYPGAVAGEVLGVDLLYRLFSDLLARSPDTAR